MTITASGITPLFTGVADFNVFFLLKHLSFNHTKAYGLTHNRRTAVSASSMLKHMTRC